MNSSKINRANVGRYSVQFVHSTIEDFSCHCDYNGRYCKIMTSFTLVDTTLPISLPTMRRKASNFSQSGSATHQSESHEQSEEAVEG